MKYILLSLLLTFGILSVHAGSDGSNIRENAPLTNLKPDMLTPEVPLFATFDESEVESIMLLVADLACRFTPAAPQETPFEDLVPANQSLSPEIPLEASFNDTP